MINQGNSKGSLFQAVKGDFPCTNGGNTAFIDLDTGESLGMQGIPKDLDYDPQSSFIAIKTPGRNNPFYTFTGSEDTLELDLTWYSIANTKQDVILRCKWLECMTKADGYLGRPHLCRLQWGILFQKTTWVVTSAKYKLKNWDARSGMLPTCAEQKVVLKRYVLTNPTHSEINDLKW